MIVFFRKLSLFIRGTMHSIQFTAMANASLFSKFNASLISPLVRGTLGLAFTLFTFLQIYQFTQSINKTLDAWINLSTTMLGNLLTDIAIYGSILAKIIGFSFALAPIIFLSAHLVALCNQLSNLGFNLYALKGSSERMHYLQAICFNAFMIMQSFVTIIAIILILFTSPASTLGPIFAALSVAFNVANLGWLVLPLAHKQTFKKWFGFNKPDAQPIIEQKTAHPSPKDLAVYSQIIKSTQHLSELKSLSSEEVKFAYLASKLQLKLTQLQQQPRSTKRTSKIDVLAILQMALKEKQPLASKLMLAKQHPGVFQNLFSTKSEMEELYDTVAQLLNQHKEAQREVYTSKHPALGIE